MYLQSSELCKFQRRLHDSRIRFLFCHDKWWLFCYCLIKAKFISPWANDFATIISTIETWSYLSTACACLPACLCTFFYWIRLVIQGVWKKIVLVMYVPCEVTVLSLYAYLAEIFIYLFFELNKWLGEYTKRKPSRMKSKLCVPIFVKILNVSKSVSSIFDDDTLHKTSIWKCLARNYISTLVNIPTRYDDQRWILWKNCNLFI